MAFSCVTARGTGAVVDGRMSMLDPFCFHLMMFYNAVDGFWSLTMPSMVDVSRVARLAHCCRCLVVLMNSFVAVVVW